MQLEPEICKNFAQGVNLQAWSYCEHDYPLLFYTESIILSFTNLVNFNPSITIIVLSRKIIIAKGNGVFFVASGEQWNQINIRLEGVLQINALKINGRLPIDFIMGPTTVLTQFNLLMLTSEYCLPIWQHHSCLCPLCHPHDIDYLLFPLKNWDRPNGRRFVEDISNSFSWMKVHEFRLRWRQPIIWTNDDWFNDVYFRHSAWMN